MEDWVDRAIDFLFDSFLVIVIAIVLLSFVIALVKAFFFA